jgi:hypothetical protein
MTIARMRTSSSGLSADQGQGGLKTALYFRAATSVTTFQTYSTKG